MLASALTLDHSGRKIEPRRVYDRARGRQNRRRCATGACPGSQVLAPQFLFASAAAALKCTRFGGIAGVPARAEVEQLLASVTP